MNRRAFFSALMGVLPAVAAAASGAIPRKTWWTAGDFIKWNAAPVQWGVIDTASIDYVDCRIYQRPDILAISLREFDPSTAETI